MREDPAAVIHVPHALQFLLTEENLSRNIEELKVRVDDKMVGFFLRCLGALRLIQPRALE